VLGAQRLDGVHVLVGGEQGTRVPGLPEEHPAPVVDEAGDVDGPVDLDRLEHRRQQIVEDDLPVEGHDEVVDVGPRPDVTPELGRPGRPERGHRGTAVAIARERPSSIRPWTTGSSVATSRCVDWFCSLLEEIDGT
jgi:hypothetical protein